MTGTAYLLGWLTERVGEIDIVNVDEGNTSPTSRFIAHQAVTIPAQNTSYNDKRNTGTRGTGHEERPTTNLVNKVECRQSAEAVDDTVHARGEKRSGVSIEAKLSKYGRSVVNQSCRLLDYDIFVISEQLTIASHELLEEHDTTANSQSLETGPACYEGSVLDKY